MVIVHKVRGDSVNFGNAEELRFHATTGALLPPQSPESATRLRHDRYGPRALDRQAPPTTPDRAADAGVGAVWPAIVTWASRCPRATG
jgi:hypothetical protein